MNGKLALAFFGLIVACGTASADVVDECHQGHLSKVSLRACTEIIESPNFGSDEKATAYRYRGEVRMYAGAVRPAIADFTASIRLNKQNMPAFEGRGWVKFTAGDLAGAIADYSEAIRLSPATAELYNERGHIYIIDGKPDDAIRDLTESLRLTSSIPSAFNARANAFNTRGFAYFRKGDLVRAQDDFTAAIAISQLRSVFYLNRGKVYEAEGKKSEAVDDFQTALMLDPSLIEAMISLKRLGGETTTAIQSDQRIRQGKELAEKNCSSCHAVGATGRSPNKDATPFRIFYRRHPNLYLRIPTGYGIDTTHDRMPPFQLSREDMNAIIAYIDSFVPQQR
jgi:Tfp pilus assembly protein PilF/cytochrome c5